MNTKRVLSIIMVVLVAALVLAACSRSASKAPATATAANKGDFPSLNKTQQVSQQDMIKTQTAISKQNLNPILDQPTATTAGEAPAEPGAPQATATQAPAEAQATKAPAAPVVSVNVPTVTPGKPGTYTLQKGEFVYCIARRFNVNPNDLLSVNGISKVELVYEGMTLKIPNSGKFPDGRALKKHPAQYTVAAGDTIYSIACKYGDVEPWAIAMANNLAAPYTLTAGTTITIP